MSDRSSGSLPRTRQLIEDGLARDLHRGFQLFVQHRGETVADAAFGESAPGMPMTTGTLTLWMSSGKPVTAVLIARQLERGTLSLDDAVAQHIPEFAAGGKDAVTLRHLLTHTGGFRTVDTGWPEASWDEIIARICAAPLEPDWIPGERAGYHVASSWFILGEILRRLEQRPFAQLVREELFEPIGLRDTWNGMPASAWQESGDRIGWMYARKGSTAASPSSSTTPGRAATLVPLDWHNETRCAAASPGGNTRGPIRELGRFYAMLLAGGTLDGVTILRPETVELLTRRHRTDMFDETFRHRLDFGLGVIVNSNEYGAETVPYGFGRFAAPRTFGHGGSQSSIGFADPENDLVVAWAANGMIGEPQHHRRNRAINEAIYEDLGLAEGGRRQEAGGR